MKHLLLIAAFLGLATMASAQEERVLWISIGDSPTNLAGLTTKINTARTQGFNAVCFLARYRSNAYYVPNRIYGNFTNPEPMVGGVSANNDPLQHVIDIAKPLGMRVYAAWPTFIVTDGAAAALPAHINPTWVQWWYSGASPASSYAPFSGFPKVQVPNDIPAGEGRDGYWLDPGVPAVRAYTISVLMDVVENYDIDGVIFDRVRYPGDAFPKNDRSYGYNPLALQAFGLINPAPGSNALLDARRGAVTTFLAEASAAIYAEKPWVITASSPVVYGTATTDTYSYVFQHFPSWNTAANPGHVNGVGVIDMVMPQLYRSSATDNRNLINLIRPDVTNMMHAPIFRAYGTSGELATFGANGAMNVCDTRNAAYGTKGSSFFAASGFQNSSFHTPFSTTSTSCGTNVYGTQATPFAFTNKKGWDGVATNTVTTLAAVADEARITLNWTTPPAASDSDVPLQYLVYRSTAGSVAQTWANLVNKDFTVRGNQFVDQPNAGLTLSGTYRYIVVGVDEYNNKSAASNQAVAAVSFGSDIAKARTMAPVYTDNFTGTGNSTSNSAAPGNPAGGSRFSTTIGEKGIYTPAIPVAGFHVIDITTDNASSHNANANWTITTPFETRNNTVPLPIRGQGTGNVGDIWGPIITHPIYFAARPAGSADARLELTNIDGNDNSTRRLNLDAIRVRFADRYPIRVHGRKKNAAPIYQFLSPSGPIPQVALSGVTVDGYIEYSEVASNANDDGLATGQLLNRKFVITKDPALAFGTSTVTLYYGNNDLNGLQENAGSLAVVYKDGEPIPSGNVAFNYGTNSVTVTGQTTFGEYLAGTSAAQSTAAPNGWMLLAD